MPRMKNESSVLLADLKARLDRMVATAKHEGRDEALVQLRNVLGGAAPRRGPGRPPKSAAAAAKPKRKRKNPWTSMTPEQKAERVRKMLAGRGLKPKSEA
jgi:hypothetical protein